MKMFRYSIIFSLVCNLYASEIHTIEKYLDNKNCKSGVTHRTWEDAYSLWTNPSKPETFEQFNEELHQFIVLHYTAGVSLEGTISTYNEKGVSAHYTIANDGNIYITVDPDKDIAYHAGVSYFAGKSGLNYYSIGIEHVNPGYREANVSFAGFSSPKKLSGSSLYWYPFSESQFVSSMSLTRSLQNKYNIPGFFVVTHADIAPSRKSDIDPMWNYKRAFEEFGVGYWPSETHAIDLNSFSSLSDDDYKLFISFLGYEHSPKSVYAYQLHYSISNISGILTEQTRKDILKHMIALYEYTDPISHTKFEFFISNLEKWAQENLDKASAFVEYIDL